LIILRIAERYEEDLEAIFFVKLLYVTDLFGLADNVSAVCYVCVPRPLGGDGVVFANAAHYYIFILITQWSRRNYKLTGN